MNLLVQSDSFSAELGTVMELVGQYNWLNKGKDAILVMNCNYDSLLDSNIINITKGYIPVGSIDFSERVLKLTTGVPHMAPLLVPEELKPFARRKTEICSSKEEILHLFDEWKQPELFIKSASVLKGDYTDIYTKEQIESLPEDELYFVSEIVNIVSEWRAFVFNGKILDVKNYDGDYWQMPDKNIVERMVYEYSYESDYLKRTEKNGENPPAYTLDVAVIEKDNVLENAVVEVHNFVSCGFYGFDHPLIPQMLKKGWEWEKQRAANFKVNKTGFCDTDDNACH